MISKTSALACALFVAGACILSPGCAESPPPRAVVQEHQPPPSETNPTPGTAKAAEGVPDLPPQSAEVNGAVERVFKGAVTIETDRNPYFIVGDFNGDHSQDIAVVVKPAPGRLPEINDELAAWILVAPVELAAQSPKNLPYPDVHGEAVRRQRVRIDEGDVLLAVIHGFESNGWRDPQATQTYLLKDATGGQIRTRASRQVLTTNNEKKLPRLWGDVIAQTIGGQSGFLYYNGAKYAWYDPRSYEPAPPARIIHGGSSANTAVK